MKRNLHATLANTLTCIILSLGATAVQAATITLSPLNSVVAVGSTFNVTIVGSDFTHFLGGSAGGSIEGTIGGGFSLAWNPGILILDTYNLTFPGDQLFGRPGVVNNTDGTLLRADVTSYTGINVTSFDIAVLTFTALSPGVSVLDLSGSDIPWRDPAGFYDMMPVFKDGSVEVRAVPVPAAVCLFGSGLLGLIGMARRRS